MEHDHAPPPPPQSLQPSTEFEAVPLRARHDGWTPERQVAFIEALAETACVVHAAAAVGMSATAAYQLRRRPEAQAFRLAWDAALDFGVRRLEDAALSRATHGVARPVFFQGQQIGERRYYDERLTQFILRRRDPVRFGDWRNGREAHQHFDGPALLLARMLGLAEESAYMGEESGTPAVPEVESLAAALGVGMPKPDEDEEEDDGDHGEEWTHAPLR